MSRTIPVFTEIVLKLKDAKEKAKIVFPEGAHPYIQQVANEVSRLGLMHPIVIFSKREEVPKNMDPNVEIVVIEEEDLKHYTSLLMEIRKGKIDESQARMLVTQRNYFATLLLQEGRAEGLVGGIQYSTADMLRPGLQIVKTKPGVKTASSSMLMLKGNKTFIFSDISLNIKPTAEQIVDITKSAIDVASIFEIQDPKVALLSFSTAGSANHEEAKKMSDAAKILKAEMPHAKIDGEIQFDAALREAIRIKKAGSTTFEGQADVLVFPDLNSGNIGYKIAQELGSYQAVGPVISGLAKPFNDLSRGAKVEDIISTSIITAKQVLEERK